ncbi:SCO6745 family protein [Streptomyces sulphureus]|uniref:SCO6745 family protein n=1 Tax=Streptomyces sulphureus TaxID=47758 RepID=UPI00036C3B9B|nr:hypothetical protein [Streptomyces sulphureus]
MTGADDLPTLARHVWQHLEPLYAGVYFAPEVGEEVAALGYGTQARWPSYFALRAAPLGRATAELTTATFYSFAPARVAAHVPAAWQVADPDAVLAARTRGVDRALRTLLGPSIGSEGLEEAARLARTAAESADVAGRPLAAANRALGWPQEPHMVLWQAANVLREHRGDGHLAALLGAPLDGCEALVSLGSTGAVPVANFASRGWSSTQWEAAEERLRVRGLVDAEGSATPAGHRLRADVERTTDELSAAPYAALGRPACERLVELLRPLVLDVVQSGLLPQESTLGILTVPAPGPRE